MNVEAGQSYFNEVVLVGGENTVVGTPLVAGATVVGTVENKENKRKLLLTSTNLKKVATVNKVTVNHIQSCHQRNQRLILRRTHTEAVFERAEDGELRSGNYKTRRDRRTALMSCVHRFLRLPLTLSIPLRNLRL